MPKKTTFPGNPPFNAYIGKEPYIFISYSHRDKDIVYKELAYLNNEAYKIWYDEGIIPSKDFVREITDAIDRCSLFIVFVSKDSAYSQYVDREIKYAFENNKPILAIYLEEVKLPSHLKFLLGTTQAIMKYNMNNEIYSDKLIKSLYNILNATPPTPPTPPIPPKPPVRISPILYVIGGIILISLLIILYYTGVFERSDVNTPVSASSTTNTVTTTMKQDTSDSIGSSVGAANDVTSAADPEKSPDSTGMSPEGVAAVTLQDGREISVPINFMIFKAYGNLVTGFPVDSNEMSLEDISKGIIPFDKVQSFEVTQSEEYGKYSVNITLTDGKKVEKIYSDASIMGPAGSEGMDYGLKDIKSVVFRHKDAYTPEVSMATIETPTGGKYTIPADTIKLRLLTMGFGPSPSWLDGFPIIEGNTVEFRKIKTVKILEGKSTGMNGWDQEIKMQLTLTDGTDMITTAKGDAFALYGLNKFGIFRLGLVDELKSISFDWIN